MGDVSGQDLVVGFGGYRGVFGRTVNGRAGGFVRSAVAGPRDG